MDQEYMNGDREIITEDGGVFPMNKSFNSLWQHWMVSGSTLAQVMACCLTTPSHDLNQCCLIISNVLWEILKKSVIDMSLEMNNLRLQLSLPGCNELMAHCMGKLTLNVWGPSYLGLTRSISWLLMPWLLTLPGHQQPWYWLCIIGRFLSYLRKDLNYLRRINVEKWYKM